MLTQSVQHFNAENRIVTVKTETQSTHTWINGEPQFSDSEVIVIESTNSEGNNHLRTVMPLAAAIEFAKAVLATQQQAQDDAWIDEQWLRYQDRFAMEDDAMARDIVFVDDYQRYGVEHSVQ